MSALVMTTIPDGVSVRVFKEGQKIDFSKYVLRWKDNLIFAIEEVEVPKNLTAGGLISFARATFKNANPDNIITKRNLQ